MSTTPITNAKATRKPKQRRPVPKHYDGKLGGHTLPQPPDLESA